jgi:hypothetical protein
LNDSYNQGKGSPYRGSNNQNESRLETFGSAKNNSSGAVGAKNLLQQNPVSNTLPGNLTQKRAEGVRPFQANKEKPQVLKTGDDSFRRLNIIELRASPNKEELNNSSFDRGAGKQIKNDLAKYRPNTINFEAEESLWKSSFYSTGNNNIAQGINWKEKRDQFDTNQEEDGDRNVNLLAKINEIKSKLHDAREESILKIDDHSRQPRDLEYSEK